MYIFILRVYRDSYQPIFYNFNNITISDITLISKRTKFDPVCEHKGNQKKFGYNFYTKGKFSKVAGSHSAPVLAFKGEFIDIVVRDFPRYPVLYQDKYHARNMMNDRNYTGVVDYRGDGFEALHFEILNLQRVGTVSTESDYLHVKNN